LLKVSKRAILSALDKSHKDLGLLILIKHPKSILKILLAGIIKTINEQSMIAMQTTLALFL
jgi:hypothetical protein